MWGVGRRRKGIATPPGCSHTRSCVAVRGRDQERNFPSSYLASSHLLGAGDSFLAWLQFFGLVATSDVISGSSGGEGGAGRRNFRLPPTPPTTQLPLLPHCYENRGGGVPYFRWKMAPSNSLISKTINFQQNNVTIWRTGVKRRKCLAKQ